MATNIQATREFSLHTTGYAIDIAKPRAEAPLRFLLERLQALERNLLGRGAGRLPPDRRPSGRALHADLRGAGRGPPPAPCAPVTARRLVQLLVTVVLLAAGCDDDDDAVDTTAPPTTTTQPEPEPPSAETKGVVLSLDRDTPHAGETLQLTVENQTRERLEYGLAYQLEQRKDSRWVWINEDAAFALILSVK